jgi:hypothetical protein
MTQRRIPSAVDPEPFHARFGHSHSTRWKIDKMKEKCFSFRVDRENPTTKIFHFFGSSPPSDDAKWPSTLCCTLVFHNSCHICTVNSVFIGENRDGKFFQRGEASWENRFCTNSKGEKKFSSLVCVPKITLIICKTHFFVIIHDGSSPTIHP